MKRVHKGPMLPELYLLVSYGTKGENWKLFTLAQALTVTASAWVKAREDSRTDSTKRPEGGNGGVGRAIRKYETWGPG